MALRARIRRTEVVGPIRDPAHLRGLLERMHRLELTLHRLTPLETESAQLTRSRTHTLPQSTTVAPRERTVARVLSLRRRCAAAEASCHTPPGS